MALAPAHKANPVTYDELKLAIVRAKADLQSCNLQVDRAERNLKSLPDRPRQPAGPTPQQGRAEMSVIHATNSLSALACSAIPEHMNLMLAGGRGAAVNPPLCCGSSLRHVEKYLKPKHAR